MALFEVVLRARYFGQNTINRFNYVSSGTPAIVSGSFGLLSAMGFIPSVPDQIFPSGTLFEALRANVTSEVSFVEIECRDVYSATDFYLAPFVQPVLGALPGGGLSPAAALGFRTSRVRTDIDRGTKRFVGVYGAYVGAGGVLGPFYQTGINLLAQRLGETLEYNDEGNTLTYNPAVVGKEQYQTPSGRKAYRYYPTLAQQMQRVASGFLWQPYENTRTQRSRQYGQGI